MHPIIITTVALLLTFVAAIGVRNEHKSAIDSQCFICPPIKSFRFGIRPWQRYEPSDIKFQQHENSFSCIYKAAAYTLADKHDPLTAIGRCNYYNDGVLRRENKDKDTASSVECPRVAPSYKGCGYRVHAARDVEKRQEPGEQTPQEILPPSSPGETSPPGELVTGENEPDENENEDPENEVEGDEEEEEEDNEEESEGDEDEGDEEEGDEDEEDEEEDEEDEDE
ncbi:hypothetical protein BDZ94DRAFT_1310516 [Collybia nuda]|uniref:Uncharacterized protein n=1 Tax=Collybia nuda TaxID=64659 RepID=A0A9P6CI24_9AGAR|nr:hypothetical protein BDZ94DRAFT_1310516 [Collybia nuda]